MFTKLKSIVLGALLVLGFAAQASAQITIPNTFVTRQIISSSKMNANFNQLGLQALNRQAPVLQATLVGDTDNLYDLGSAAVTFRTAYLKTSIVLAATGGNYTLTWANPAAARAISIADPGGTDVFTFNAATQTLTNKTLTSPTISSPTLSGTVAGTFTIGGTPTLSSNLAVTGSLQFTGSVTYPGAGSISKNAGTGLVIGGVAGSLYDFGLVNPSGASGIMLVPTGTLNVTFGGLLTINGVGTSTFTAANAGSQTVQFVNTSSGTASREYLQISAGTNNAYFQVLSQGWTTSNDLIQNGAALETTGVGGLQLSAINGALGFWTGATPSLRWGVNSAGDFTFGPSNHIVDSDGTPICTASSGCDGAGGSVTGTDYAMHIISNTASGGQAGITFGHTWSNIPVCVATTEGNGSTSLGPYSFGSMTTSSMIVIFNVSGSNIHVAVQCRSY